MKPCLTLAETSISDLESKIRLYSGRVPLIEVRLDHLESLRTPRLPSEVETRFIATCRPTREGGNFSGSETERLQILQKAAQSGFHWLDLERDAAMGYEDLPDSVGIIRSLHDFGSCPEDLRGLLQSLPRRRSEVSKLAVQVSSTRELVRILQVLAEAPKAPPRILIGMGPFGQASRYLGALLGNAWTYVCEGTGESVAPGQFTLQQFEETFLDRQDALPPAVYGVLGNPVLHSLSPFLHNALFRRYRLNGLYLPIQLDSLEEWFQYLAGSPLRFEGFSVTLPFKTAVMQFLETVDSPVQAANTAKRQGGRWVGRNTDLPGFLVPLRKRISLEGKTALVLGVGGVAHTVVSALQSAGVTVTVSGRNATKVARFCRQYGCGAIPICRSSFRTDILVNTTPVGQYPDVHQSPLPEELLDCDLVYDLIYHPRETRLLRAAQRRGLSIISGLEMFVEQAALQFEMWTGLNPDRGYMEELMAGKLR